MTSRARRRLVLLLVVAVVVGVVLLIVTNDEEATPGVRAGAAFEVSSISTGPGDRTLDFVLPSGPLKVTVGTPVRDVGSYAIEMEDESDLGLGVGDDVTTGDGARFVPVSWQVERRGVNGVNAYQFDVVLVADGQRYDLQAGVSNDSTATAVAPVVPEKALYAVVAGDLDDTADLMIEVTYEGETQVGDVDTGEIDAGLAAPLYESATVTGVAEPCSLFTDAQRGVLDPTGFECVVGQVTTSPFVAGLGWVESADETFVSVPVQVEAGFDIEREPDSSYDVRRGPTRVRLDGRRPDTTLGLYESPYLGRGTFVFRSGPDPQELELTSDLVGTKRYGRGPATIRFGGTQTFTVR